jgi:hypothetical protein
MSKYYVKLKNGTYMETDDYLTVMAFSDSTMWEDFTVMIASVVIIICPLALFFFLWLNVFSGLFGLFISAIIAFLFMYYAVIPFALTYISPGPSKKSSRNKQEYRPLSLHEQWELKKKANANNQQ